MLQQLQIGDSVRIKRETPTTTIHGDLDTMGVGQVVGFPDSSLISVDFYTENLWLKQDEIEFVPPAVRKKPSHYSVGVVECFGIGYEIPSNESDELYEDEGKEEIFPPFDPNKKPQEF